MSEPTAPQPTPPKKRKFRVRRILAVFAILSVLLILTAPWIMARTGLRDKAINKIVASPSVTASSDSASFGWFSPLSVDGLQLKSTNNHIDVRVERVVAEKPPYRLWYSAPDLGTIRVEKPHVTLELPLDVNIERHKGKLEPTFTAVLNDAALTVRLAGATDPVIDVDGINMTVRVEKADEGRVLTLDPVVVFEKRKLSPKLASNLLHLFDPTMGDVPEVNGEFSLYLDKLRVPVGVQREEAVKRLELEGKLVLHDVSTDVSSPMGLALIQLVSDVNGKNASQVVRLARKTEVRFQVRDGRFYHEGLSIGFPEIDPQLQLTSRGSVGLDRTVDLFVDVPRLDPVLRKEKGPAKCRITGTITNPKISVEDGSFVLRQHDRKEPLLAVDGINLNMQVENTDKGHVLVVEPFEVLKKKKLNLEVAAGLVKFLAPDFHDDRQVTGEVSLSMSKLRVPLVADKDKAMKQLEAEGKVTLHRVGAQVNSPMWQALIKMVADMNGKQLDKPIRVETDAEVAFTVRDGRLHHEGLRLGFPDIDPQLVVVTRGSIGLDETLDLFVDLPRLDPALRKEKGPAKCHITGTLANPKITVKDGSFVLRQHGHKEPVLAAHGIDLTVQVENTPKGRVLVVEPVEVFTKQKLNLNVAADLVKFLAPDLQSDRQVTGDVSLALSKVRVPLGGSEQEAVKQVEVEGKLTVHRVGADVKSPMWLALMKMVADMNGKQLGKECRVQADAEVAFAVRDGRMHYEGVRAGFPDIDPQLVVTTRGSIGLDETVDLFVDLPHLDAALRKEKGPAKCRITGTITNPKITVKDGSLVVREHGQKEPILATSGVDLTMQIENTPKGRVLVVEPVEVFKKTKLSLGVASGLLKLIAPDVAESERRVTGEVSLSLTRLRMPLGPAADEAVKQLEVDGKLTLHQVSADVKSPMWQGLIRVIAEMHGKKWSNVIHLVEESEINFKVREGRLYHEGQRVGFPEIDPQLVVKSKGWVGIDDSVDLDLELPRVLKGNLDKDPIQCHVAGTLLQPTIAMQDGRLVVRLKDGEKAALTVDKVKLVFGVEDTKNGKVLTLAPVTVFEKQKLTPELGDELLHLIVPTLSDLTGVQGELSLSFDTFRVPLGVPRGELEKKIELTGKLQLHQISVSTKTPLIQTMVKMLADMYGKKPSEVVRLVKNSDVKFKVKDGRMYHEGLELGFPDISPDLIAKSNGSVGFDKSLDFVLELPAFLVDKKELDIKKAPPVRFRVTGTLEKPIVTEIKDGKDK
jgi:hypothetical protein